MIEKGRLVFSDSMDAFNNYIAPQSMLLEFENAPTTDVLGIIKGVNRVEQLTPKSFRIFYDGSKTVSEAIITESVKHEWRLTQVAIEKNSIDEVFKQLTKDVIHN